MTFYLKKDFKKYKKEELDCSCFLRNVYYSCWTKAELLSNLFTRCNNIYYDNSYNGMAAIDVHSKRITVNRDKVFSVLTQAFPFVLSNIEHFPHFVSKDFYSESEYFNFEEYVSMFACYLVLHEVGHYLYSVPASVVREKAEEIRLSMRIPFSFIFFVNNVVEDSFIQRRLQLDYPMQLYRDIFFFGTTIIQGPFSVANFAKGLGEGKPLSIKDKLFYLILRAYNLFDKDVQSMFNNNPLIEWTPEVLELFDKAITILNKEDRCDFTTNKLVPALFEILHEVVKIKKDELKNCVSDGSSLLDQDKLREAELDDKEEDDDGEDDEEYDEEEYDDQNDSQSNESNLDDCFPSTNDSSKGNPDSNKPEDEDGKEKDCSGETESEEEAEGSGESSDSSEETDNSTDKNSDGDDKSTDESSSESDSNDCKSSDSKGASGFKAPDNKSLEEAAQKLEEDFDKELDDAAKELNSFIDESTEREFNEDTIKTLNKYADKVDVNDVADAINNVRKTTQKNSKSMSSLDQYDKRQCTFNNEAQTLFNTASQLFKRIYTFDTEDLSYLDNGELDEDLITDFYTEKSINIFKQHSDLIETKNIKIVFMVDDSGSMSGSRAYNCRTIVPPLIHAFEESGIKCSFFMFSNKCSVVKDFDDPIVLLDNSCSNVLYQMDRTHVGGTTDITPALLSLASRDYADKDDAVYVLFVLTDGRFDNETTARQCFKYLREQIGFKLFGITIDENDYGVKRLRYNLYENSSGSEDFVSNYSSEELITKLPVDIYNLIVDRFIRKH